MTRFAALARLALVLIVVTAPFAKSAFALEQLKAANTNATAVTTTAPHTAAIQRSVAGDNVEVTVPPSDEPQTFNVPVKTLIDGLMPYLIAAIGGLITVLGGVFAAILKQKFNVDIDKKHLDTFQQAATNAAGALLARGAVAVEEKSGKLTVSNPDMAAVMSAISARIPDALDHLGLTPEQIQATIIAKLPQLLATGTMSVPTLPTAVPAKA